MEKADSRELNVRRFEPVMVAPSLPSPKIILPLSSLDQLYRTLSYNLLLVYNARQGISADPAEIIRKALAKVLVHYFPFAGRLTSKENGEIQVECTGEGVLFVEAMADNNLSVLGDLNDIKPSFQQLRFPLPHRADIQNSHLLAVQVTHFACGGFVVGVDFHHSICDGRGARQFLEGLTEMARGDVQPSIEPVWNKELLKAEDLIHLGFHHLDSLIESVQNIHPPPIVPDKLVQASFVINSEIIQYIKKEFMEECKDFFSTFEIVAALAWKANTKALQIPNNQNVMLLFGVDMRKSANPPLPQGYYGNAIGCIFDVKHDIPIYNKWACTTR